MWKEHSGDKYSFTYRTVGNLTFFLKFRSMKDSNFEYGFSTVIAKYVTQSSK